MKINHTAYHNYRGCRLAHIEWRLEHEPQHQQELEIIAHARMRVRKPRIAQRNLRDYWLGVLGVLSERARQQSHKEARARTITITHKCSAPASQFVDREPPSPSSACECECECVCVRATATTQSVRTLVQSGGAQSCRTHNTLCRRREARARALLSASLCLCGGIDIRR